MDHWEPSDVVDERPLISDLLAEHFRTIEAVRDEILADEVGRFLHSKGSNAKRYDEIWILRFVLSHKGNVKSATRAALDTMKFREKKKLNELGDIRYRMVNVGIDPAYPEEWKDKEWLPGQEFFASCCEPNALIMYQPDMSRGVIELIDVGKVDSHAIAKGMCDAVGDWSNFNLYSNESNFQVLDHVTRTTGRLTKLCRIFDMRNVGWNTVSFDYVRQDSTACKVVEDFYPQHLGMACIVNCPDWLARMWNMGKRMLPKRVAEKVAFLPNMLKAGKTKDGLKPILRYISIDDLPEKYGGTNNQWPLPNVSKNYVKDKDCSPASTPAELVRGETATLSVSSAEE